MSENLSDAENQERMQSAFVSLQRSLQTRARPGPDPPDYEMMRDYVNNTASELDREIIASYAELHPEFAKELEDLQAFAAMMKEEEVTPEPVQKPSFFERLTAWLGLSSVVGASSVGVWRLAGTAAIILLLAGVSVLVVWQMKLGANPGDIAQLNQNAPLQSPQIPQTGNANVMPTPPPAPPETPPVVPPSKPFIAFHIFVSSRGGRPKASPRGHTGSSLSGGDDSTKPLIISQGTQAINFVAELPDRKAAGQKFEATLVTPRDEFKPLGVWQASQSNIVIKVPANKLPMSGAYSMRLKRVPATEDDVEFKYPFTVKKQ